jgi:hypothetical protein
MPHTGETCATSGLYSGKCKANGQHVKQEALSVGEKFPPCHTATCSGSVEWTLIRATK